MKLSLIEPFSARPALENDRNEGSNPIKELVVPKVQTNVETQPDLKDQNRSPQASVVYLDFTRKMKSKKAKFRQNQKPWATKKISIYSDIQIGVCALELLGTRLNRMY